jgi:hypothetical protein
VIPFPGAPHPALHWNPIDAFFNARRATMAVRSFAPYHHGMCAGRNSHPQSFHAYKKTGSVCRAAVLW